MQPAALPFPTLPAFCLKTFLEAVLSRAQNILISEGVALSLRMPYPFTWLYLFPVRDMKGSDRSVSSLQPLKRAGEELWLLVKQIQSCQVGCFFYFFPFLFCRESSLKSAGGFSRKPSLQLVDIDNCCHLAGWHWSECSKFGGLNPVIRKAGVSELVPPCVVLIES